MIKRLLQGALRRTGMGLYRLDRHKLMPSDGRAVIVLDERVRNHIFDRANISLVLDIGANQGHYGQHLRDSGFRGKILSFEPLSEPYGLLSSAAAGDPGWEAVRAGVGAEKGSLEINVAANAGQSSSFLPMLPAHSDRAPSANYSGVENVEVTTVSDCLAERGLTDESIFLKIDVQGYEMQVLRGCSEQDLRQVRGLEVELSSVPLYDGQSLIADVMQHLYSRGFYMVTYSPIWNDAGTGFSLQADGMFLRREYCGRK